VLKEYAIPNGIISDKIFVTKDVKNTADEAVAVNELISQSKRIILVISGLIICKEKRVYLSNKDLK
jgi:hypothetical protein